MVTERVRTKEPKEYDSNSCGAITCGFVLPNLGESCSHYLGFKKEVKVMRRNGRLWTTVRHRLTKAPHPLNYQELWSGFKMAPRVWESSMHRNESCSTLDIRRTEPAKTSPASSQSILASTGGTVQSGMKCCSLTMTCRQTGQTGNMLRELVTTPVAMLELLTP